MLRPDSDADRLDYSALLAPPRGFTLNMAVATTYSLDLEALTGVCLALGLSEETDSTLRQNPVGVLNAIQKVSEKVLVFCEAGQIKVPGKPGPLNLLLEKMVIPVALPKSRGAVYYPAFHPKTWVLQYVNREGQYRYRFVVLSRNLTFDRSWDVSAALDSSEEADTAEKTRPLIAFLNWLRERIEGVQHVRAKRFLLKQLAEALEGVSFTTEDSRFKDSFDIMPLGIGPEGCDMTKDPLLCTKRWAADCTFHELVVFSPFLSGSMVEAWASPVHSLKGTTRVLITRRSELSRFTREQAGDFVIYVLKDDIVDGEDVISSGTPDRSGESGEAERTQKQDIHAKIFLRRKNSETSLYLGSMNATESAVHRNVEMMLRLQTTPWYLNGAKFLEDLFCGPEDGRNNPFERAEPVEPEEDPEKDRMDQLEQTVKAVCRMNIRARVSSTGDTWEVTLQVAGRMPEGDIRIRPFRTANPKPLEDGVQFCGLDLLQLSEFYALQVRTEEAELERIILLPTEGIPAERDRAVVNHVVRDERSFVEYVSFVLEDDSLLSLMEQQTANPQGGGRTGQQLPALYEKMLSAALEDPARLSEIGRLLAMLPEDGVVPPEFRTLYETFRRTLGLRVRRTGGDGRDKA